MSKLVQIRRQRLKLEIVDFPINFSRSLNEISLHSSMKNLHCIFLYNFSIKVIKVIRLQFDPINLVTNFSGLFFAVSFACK